MGVFAYPVCRCGHRFDRHRQPGDPRGELCYECLECKGYQANESRPTDMFGNDLPREPASRPGMVGYDTNYDEWLELACKAELAARNKEWPTVYTYCTQAAELALKFSRQ